MYLIRTQWDCDAHKTAETLSEAKRIARAWDGAHIVDCGTAGYYHADNRLGWRAERPRGEYVYTDDAYGDYDGWSYTPCDEVFA